MTTSSVTPPAEPVAKDRPRLLGELRRYLRDWERYVLFLLIVAFVFAVRSLSVRPDLTSADRISRLGAWAPALLGVAAGLAFLTMAVIDTIKRPLRSAFHKRQLLDWLESDAGRKPDGRPAFESLLHLVAPRYTEDVLGLPSEQLCAQIGATLEVLLSDAKHHDQLLYALAGPHGFYDVDEYMRRSATFSPRNPSSVSDVALSDSDVELIDSRNRLSHRLQRSLDAFQVHVASAWAFHLRSLALAIACILAAVGAFLFGAWATDPIGALAVVLLAGVIGGVLSSTARDLVAVLERLRR